MSATSAPQVSQYLAHRRLGPAVALDVGAAGRDRQMLRQHDGKGLEHQGVAGRPEIDILAIGQREPSRGYGDVPISVEIRVAGIAG